MSGSNASGQPARSATWRAALVASPWFVRTAFAACWLASVLVQVWLALHTRGFVGDQRIFWGWMQAIHQYGLPSVYRTMDVDYPPVYLWVLGLYARLASAGHWAVPPTGAGMKWPGIAIAAAAMPLFYWVTRGVRPGWRVFILAFFCLNPAVIYDTAVWGQVDILDGILVLAALAWYLRRPALAGGSWAVGLLAKFQSIVVLPVLGGLWLRDLAQRSYRRAAWFAAGAALPLLAVSLYFAGTGTLGQMVFKAYIATTGEYPYVTLNAMNVWYFVYGGMPWMPDTAPVLPGLTVKALGLILLAAATLYALVYLWWHADLRTAAVLKAAAMLSLAFFMLPTEIHERYILMAVMLSVAAAAFDRRWAWLAAGLTLSAWCNLMAVVSHVVNPDQDMWMVYLNALVFAVMCVLMQREVRWPASWRAFLPAR